MSGLEEEHKNGSASERNLVEFEDLNDEDYEPLGQIDYPTKKKDKAIKQSIEAAQTIKVQIEAEKWDLKQDLSLLDFARDKKNNTARGTWESALQGKKIQECGSRTAEALRTRYKTFLQNLTDDEIKRMRDYYEEHGNGVVNYKTVTINDGGKKRYEKHINTISELQPHHHSKIIVPRYTGKTIKDTKHILSAQQREEILSSGGDEEPLERNPTLAPRIKRKAVAEIEPRSYKDFKKLKPIDDIWHNAHSIANVFAEHSNIEKYPSLPSDVKLTIYVDFDKKTRIPIIQNMEDHENAKVKMEKEKLMALAKTYHMTYANIKELFYRVSGNYDNLKEALDDANDKLIWTPEDDEDLKHALENPRLMKYLIANKGEENIQERKKFLEVVGNL